MASLLFMASAQFATGQESVLYSFSFNEFGAGTDGAAPIGNLVFDSAGNLYGATSSGGSTNDAGMIYELSPKSGGGWTEKILYAFPSGVGGSAPTGSLIFDSNGNLYGTATNLVFELSPQAGGVWTEQTLYTFSGLTDANAPNGGLIFDKSGNLYGTSLSGGANAAYGTVFELSPPQSAGGAWTEQVLHSFNNNFVDGYRPLGSLIFDADGNLYGTTSYGGANGQGTVFELTPGAGGVWTEKILFNQTYSETPYANLIFDTDGNLYSTSFSGGAKNGNALNGTVFELSPPQTGTAWTEQILHSFPENATDGGSLAGGLIFDANGNLYSTTFHGGPYYTQNNTANTDGTIFEMLPQQSGGWAEGVLYFFGTATNDGVLPASGLIADSKGNLYGETSEGGEYGYGAVYEYTPVPTTALPVFSPNSGVYSSAVTVTITDPGATIYYTTDGTTPTTSSPVYSGSFSVSTTETVQAIGVTTGLANSPVAWATYTIEPTAATPLITPDGGSFTKTTAITITDATPGSVIYYSTTGATPTTPYSTAIFVSSSETITAFATATGYAQSATASAAFTVTNPVPTTTSISPTSAQAGGAAFTLTVTGTNFVHTSTIIWNSTALTTIYVSATELQASIPSTDIAAGGTAEITVTNPTPGGGTSTPALPFSIESSTASITSPAAGSVLPGPTVTFTWNSATGAGYYELYIGSTGVGASNLYSSGSQTGTSLQVAGLPTNGETLYVRLLANFSGTWKYVDYTYSAVSRGVLTSPTPGSVFGGPNVTFAWTAATGTQVSGYRLYLGSTGAGSNNLYSSALQTGTSFSAIALPTNGETIYARLITSFNGTLAYSDYTYTADTHAVMTSPAPGGLLPGKTVTFTWSAAVGGTYYELWLGSTGPGSYNLYNSLRQTVTSITVGGLPNNGETIYARVLTDFNGSWAYADYTFTAVTAPVMSSPAQGSVLPGPTVTFTWGGAMGASAYELYIGSTGAGSNNLYNSGSKTVTTLAVSNLPTNGETIYVRLLTNYNGSWAYSDYTYTAATHAVLATPAAGSTLGAAPVTFTITPATGTEATAYELYLGSTGVGSSDLYSSGQTTATTFTVKTLPTNGETIYARVLTNFGGSWGYVDYTYVAQ
jgi:uncharacterized repeat protein (TIGR03803 family)